MSEMQFRKIQRNHALQKPSRVISLATCWQRIPDTYRGRGHLRKMRYGHARFTRKRSGEWKERSELSFRDGNAFWQWVLNKCPNRTRTWIVCHDVRSDVTLSGLWRWIDSQRIAVDCRSGAINPDRQQSRSPSPSDVLFVWEGPPTILGLRTVTGGAITVVDLLNWWRRSWPELAAEVGMPMQAHPDPSDSEALAAGWCAGKTAAIERLFTRLASYVEDNDLGNFRTTAAGQSWAAYRHRWMVHPIYPCDDADIAVMERQAYYGGWIEPFYLGTVNDSIIHVDVNALYPAEMAVHRFPVKIDRHSLETAWRSGPPPCWDSGSIAEVMIDSPRDCYPTRYCGRTCMARGTYRTTLAGPELRRAVRSGHVRAHRRWIQYRMRPLFASFVQDLWEMRQNEIAKGNALEGKLCKLLMNAITGKFAQMTPGWEPRPNMPTPFPWGRWNKISTSDQSINSYLAIGSVAFEEVKRKPKPGTMPAISAFVTAHGREFMRYLIAKSGLPETYYVGVDCLLVSPTGYERLNKLELIRPDSLGYLRKCGEYPRAEIYAPNCYRVGNRTVFAGTKTSAVQEDGGTMVQVDTPTLCSIFECGGGEYLSEFVRTLRYVPGNPGLRFAGKGWQPPVTLDGAPLRDADGHAVIDGCASVITPPEGKQAREEQSLPIQMDLFDS